MQMNLQKFKLIKYLLNFYSTIGIMHNIKILFSLYNHLPFFNDCKLAEIYSAEIMFIKRI